MRLDRPLAFIDIESTGTDVAKDRIIDIGLCCYMAEFAYPLPEELDNPERPSFRQAWRVNPGIPIPLTATACHGITDEDVKDCPPFKDVAPTIHRALDGCDLAGFNLSQFDVPLLWEEFDRAGITWNLDGVLVIDAKNIFFKKEARTLSAAVQFYCGEEHVEAHSALADAMATVKVLQAQLNRYPDLGCLALDTLAAFCQMDDLPRIDLAGKLVRDKDGDAVYTFGPKRGAKVKDDPGFARWMLSKDFSHNTKIAVEKELERLYKREAAF